MTNADAEMEIVRRITPEHISQELVNGHARAMRHLDIQEKGIDNDMREREREHERDQRDRDEQKLSDGRIERIFYVMLAATLLLALALVLKGKEDLAIKGIGGLVAILVTLAGGVGVERWRQDRAGRRRGKGKASDSDTDP